MRRLLLIIGLICVSLLVACKGQTGTATSVTSNSAKLAGTFYWSNTDGPGQLWYEYKKTSGSTWTATPHENFPQMSCGGGPNSCSAPDTDPPVITGLDSSTPYVFRVCGWFDSNPSGTTTCYDKDGTASGTNYSTFTTLAPPPAGFSPGIVGGGNLSPTDLSSLDNLRPPQIRMERDITDDPSVAGTSQTEMDAVVAGASARGVKVLWLAGFSGFIPTTAQSQILAKWADRYGPGGVYWQSHSGGAYASTQIEFGNETSYGYQYGSGPWTDLATRAAAYAQRAKDAANAIALTGRNVDLIVQADNGGSGTNTWVNGLHTGVSNLDTYIGGWTVHPYGNQSMWQDKIDKVISQTNAVGWSNTVPIDVTEYGISSDDGNTLYGSCSSGHDGCSPQGGGQSATETYAQASSDLTAETNGMRSLYSTRLRDFMVYSIHDLTTHNNKRCNSNTQSCREDFFGGTTYTAGDKGGYTAAVRALWGTSPSSFRPVVRNVSGSTPASLRIGSSTGSRLQLKGVTVWGLPDHISINNGSGTQHWLREYNNRAAIAAQVKAWGGNVVRLRVLAGDYNDAPNANTASLTKAQYVQHVKDWRDAVEAQGLYLQVTGWDALDGDHANGAWPGTASDYDQMFADIYAALGNDERVIYEPTNEPNNVTFAQWNTNMRHTIQYFRETIGYKGLLVIDPIWWANSGSGGQGYDDTQYSDLETYDAARTGMGSKHQLAFAKHDYAQSYAGKVWNGSSWSSASGGSQINHLIFESEFGNYNGSPSTVDNQWSIDASDFFRQRFASQETYVGAEAFLWGPWTDANSITGTDDVTPVAPWGTTVRDHFLN